MNDSSPKPAWSRGDAYERYMGRWSRLFARAFLAWLELPASRRWLDVGCGTGALSQTILDMAAPSRVQGLDFSEGFIQHAHEQVSDGRAEFEVGDAQALPYGAASFDVVVSGLALNFIPDPARALAEMVRVTRIGGTVAIYVWDYAGGMPMIDAFWDAAGELDPQARSLGDSVRASLGGEGALQTHFYRAGLTDVSTQPLELPMRFTSFDDYWTPFLGGQGTAPSYLMALNEAHRTALRDLVRSRLPFAEDGGLEFQARTWAVRGKRPDPGSDGLPR